MRAVLVIAMVCACGPGRPNDTATNATTGDPAAGTNATDAATAGAPSTGMSTGATTGAGCRPLVELAPGERDQLCADVPWSGPPDCPPQKDPSDCRSIVAKLVESCVSQIDTCEYASCADALAASTCGMRPSECDPLTECFSAGE